MNWNKLTSEKELENIDIESKNIPIMIFKHSTRCSISSTALNRLEREWKDNDNDKLKPYYLDLISYRDISNEISNKYNIIHESPQVLIIKDGACTYNNSHMGINYSEIISH